MQNTPEMYFLPIIELPSGHMALEQRLNLVEIKFLHCSKLNFAVEFCFKAFVVNNPIWEPRGSEKGMHLCLACYSHF